VSQYKIADLERLSGIKAHTIRIWEKRYNLIKPHRSDTNIRFYSDEHLRKLLNVSTLLSGGMKISEVSSLSEKEIARMIQGRSVEDSGDGLREGFINNLVSATFTFDEAAFEKAFTAALTRFGLYQAMIEVFFPFLRKTGLLWSVRDIMPAQEHFAAALIRRKLMAAIDGIPLAPAGAKKVLLFLPENEWHETGLLLADYVLRHKLYTTVYLGPNVPLDNVIKTCQSLKPAYVLTLITIRGKEGEHNRMLARLSRAVKAQILFSGAPDLVEELKIPHSVKYLPAPQDLINFLH